MERTTERPWEQVAEVVESADSDAAQTIVEELAAHDLARSIAHLDGHQVRGLLDLLQTRVAAEALERLSEAQAADVVGELEPERAAEILGELSLRDQTDLLDAVGGSEADSILDAMESSVASSVRSLGMYEDGSAGNLMEPDALAFEADTALSDVVSQLQRGADVYGDYQIQYLHVTKNERLVGVVRLRDLLLNPPHTRLGDIVLPELFTVPATTDLRGLMSAFEDHPLLGLPVVDDDGRLLGIVERADVERAQAEQSEGEYRKAQGIIGGEELRSLPLWTRSSRRLSWLSINVVLNVIAASVIAAYQDTLQAVIALAAFLPIISDMSGCSGNQAVAVSMRELSLGIIKPSDAWYVWRKEALVAVINGLVLGVLIGGVAWLWQQNLYLSLVVGIALALNTLIAVSIGGSVPLVLRGMGLDPALASGPILTTVTDMCGFFLALGLATVWLSQIVA